MKVLRITLIILVLLASVLVASSAIVEADGNPPGFAADHILVKFKAGTAAATERTIHAKHSGSVSDEIAPLGVEVVQIPKGKVQEEVSAYQSVEAPGNPPALAADHILVKFKAGIDAATERTIHARHSGSVSDEIAPLGIEVVQIPKGKVQEEVSGYQSEGSVEYAEPDYDVTTALVPNDQYYNSTYIHQWALPMIQAPQAWDVTTGNSSIKIAILDTGVDQDHEDLAAKIVANVNFSNSTTVDDLYGHGTATAGVAAAITNNGIGVASIGWNSTIMNVKVVGDNNQGLTSWVASGITWAADHGAKAINMSLITSASSTLENAVNYAWGKGVVLVAAVGNNNSTVPVYPAYYANVISVAATNQSDVRAGFSTYGSWVDVAAPGDAIYLCFPNHTSVHGVLNYGYMSGTSMSAPLVAGLAALVWSTPYGTSNASVRSRIESTADPIAGTGTYWQYGRINAYKAVAPDSVATLSNLTISSGTLTPGFASGTTSYTDSVASSVSSVTVTPTAHESHATIKVNGTAVASGTASGPITLSVGDNTITILVTAQNGTTTDTYTVSVTRLPPPSAGIVESLLPATENNKAGRTMPVKFSLTVDASTNPSQPFVYSEGLTIKIFATSNPGNILQTSTFGSGARNYRIADAGKQYITNFQTLETPMQYTVQVYSGSHLVGSFTFKTVK